jgi:hypothetical protein
MKVGEVRSQNHQADATDQDRSDEWTGRKPAHLSVGEHENRRSNRQSKRHLTVPV